MFRATLADLEIRSDVSKHIGLLLFDWNGFFNDNSDEARSLAPRSAAELLDRTEAFIGRFCQKSRNTGDTDTGIS